MEIDFVIPWVDGADPAWLAEKALYQPAEETENAAANRFRDWGLMKYWFRGIEKYTPWVRKIHFVTWGHVPDFLDTTHPKLHLVRHEDYLPREVLPTFSSHAIELSLHCIPGLAEHFVYFNDDTFILRPMPETAFFRDGLPCTMGAESPIELIGPVGTWLHAAANDLGVVNGHFDKRAQVRKFRGKYVNRCYSPMTNIRTLAVEALFPNGFVGFRNLHAPAAYRKQTFEEVWAAEPELLRRATGHRFRSETDVNQWVMLWWQVASGQFAPAVIDSVTWPATAANMDGLTCDVAGQRRDMVCINDPDGEVDYKRLADQVRAAFDKILPDKCSFEK